MVKLCWVITLLAACAAAFQLADTYIRAQSAPQQAAGAALALAVAIIPYVFSRCVAGLAKPDIATVRIETPKVETGHSADLVA